METPTNFPTRLLTAEQVAEKLCFLSIERLEELCEAGYAPYIRIDGGEPLFRFQEIQRWVTANLLQHNPGKVVNEELTVVTYPPVADAESIPESLLHMAGVLKEGVMPERYGPGVYFLCLGDAVVYVGQSTHPASRIMQHLEGKEFDRYYILPVPRSQLDTVEGAFIRTLNPSQQGRRKNTIVAPRNTGIPDAEVVGHRRFRCG